MVAPSYFRIEVYLPGRASCRCQRVQRPAPDRQGNHRPMEEAVIALGVAWVS